MAIVNLIIKPFTSFVLYRMYQDRGGNYSDFGISGIPGIPNLGGSSGKFPFENKTEFSSYFTSQILLKILGCTRFSFSVDFFCLE